MFWRLMASMIAVTDAGSVSITQSNTDWPSERICKTVKEQLYSQPQLPATVVFKDDEYGYNNVRRRVIIKVSAECVLVQP